MAGGSECLRACLARVPRPSVDCPPVRKEFFPVLSPEERAWLHQAVRAVMWADGKAHPGEETLLHDLAQRLKLPPALAEVPARIVPKPAARRFLLTILHWMAQADRVVDAAEIRVLRELTASWQVSEDETQEAASSARRWVQEGYRLGDIFI